MKRFHVHVSVAGLRQSVRFYSTLFGIEPAMIKGDYAKWMIDDPRVNFSNSQRGAQPGLDHLGRRKSPRSLGSAPPSRELTTLRSAGSACMDKALNP